MMWYQTTDVTIKRRELDTDGLSANTPGLVIFYLIFEDELRNFFLTS